MQKNEYLFDLASKTEKLDSIYPVLEQWLDVVNKNNEKFLLAARNYFSQLLTKTPYVRALILKGSVGEVHGKQRHQCLVSVNMNFSR